MKNNKVITLIALVITIIVLLILAGVSIAMLTGDNGILTQASTSKTNTQVAEVVERVNMELDAQYSRVLAGEDFNDKATIEGNIGTVNGYTITATVTSGTSLQIVVTQASGSTATLPTTATGSITKSGNSWQLTQLAK